MEAVLQQINKIQGVVGSLVCDEDGALLCHQLPSSIAATILKDASGILADSIVGLKPSVGEVGLLDLRYSDGRLLVKPLASAYLLLLCDPKINLQLLNMTLDVSIKKLEKTIAGQSASAPVSAAAASVAQELRRDGKGVVLTVDSMKASSKIKWDQMKEDAAVSKPLAVELGKLLNVDSLKKVRLVNRASGKSKVFHLIVYEKDGDPSLDDKIALTLAASEALVAKPGDEIVAEAGGGGFFG